MRSNAYTNAYEIDMFIMYEGKAGDLQIHVNECFVTQRHGIRGCCRTIKLSDGVRQEATRRPNVQEGEDTHQ